MGRFLGWLLLAFLVYAGGAEATSHLLYGAEFHVEGPNSLSDVQDWIVLLWPVWLACLLLAPFMMWSLVKVLKPWSTRHARYVSWKESPRHWVSSLLAGRKRDRLHAEAVSALEAQRLRAEEERMAAQARALERARERARQRDATLSLRSSVKSRIPKDADDFESVCAEWVVNCGIDAQRTDKGPDGGLDVIGPDFAGQCKFHPSNKVGAPDVQQLEGAANQAGKRQKAFFHYGPGYTPQAIEAARSLGVQLWEMDVDRNTFRKVD